MSDLRERLAGLSPAQREALARRLAAARPAEAPAAPDDAIAVVSAACRLPGGVRSPEDLWAMLIDGRDGVTAVPADRWDGEALFSRDPATPDRIASATGGFLDGLADFDAAFFGISPREAELMDPQQRLLLELAWESFERAGIPAAQLAGGQVGVFIGAHSLSIDYHLLQLGQPGGLAPHGSTGAAHSILANRLSYVFDLRGPSMVIDTACSSSLVAVHQACQSLRTGESDVALAGGVNLMLLPSASLAFTKLEILSPGGRCRTFDAAADGIARGEGCALVLLKRLGDALRDGDPVLAVIRGSAVNQDGASNGLTAPNGPAQVAVVRRALSQAGIAPQRVGLVETHGTGTALGDPVEVEALAEVLGGRADPAHTCWLGALKTHIGHLEAAAGIAGLIKTVWCLREGRVPANLHFSCLNPHLHLEGTPFRLPASHGEWPPIPGPRVAGVSSFGFGGTNAHVVLEAHDAAAPAAASPAAAGVQVLPVSARSDAALQARVRDLRAVLETTSAQRLSDIVYTLAARRDHGSHRLAVIGEGPAALAAALDARAALPPAQVEAEAAPVFVYTGQGSQWPGMARELVASEAVFREAVQAVAAEVDALAGGSLMAVLTDPQAGARLEATDVAQPALFAMQVGLTALWRSWGVVPAAVVGHSVGEIAAAHAAGVLTLADATRLVVHRGRLMQAAAGRGGMMQVEAAEPELAQDLLALGGVLDVAGLNGPQSTVVAGPAEALDALARRLGARGIAAQRLPVDFAFHSAQMAAFGPELARAVPGLVPRAAGVPVASTLHGGWHAEGDFGPDYWARSLRAPVRFLAAMQTLLDAGFSTFLEVGPHPALGPGMLATAVARGSDIRVAASLRKGRPAGLALRASLAELYEAGVPVDWAALSDPDARVISLPPYPWQRRRHWLGPVDPDALAFNVVGRPAAQASPPAASAGLRLDWEHRDDPLPASGPAAMDLGAVRDAGERMAASLPDTAALAAESGLLDRVERRALDHALDAVRALAPAPIVPSLPVPADGRSWGVAARHQRLWERVAGMLAEAGWLRPAASGWTVAPAALEQGPAPLPSGERERIEVALLERCGAALADVLRGQVEPLTLLFPDDDRVSAATLYGQAGASRVYNRLMGRVVAEVAARLGRERLRVLEIGAGTGATTECVLAQLAPQTSYTFTDVSAAFLDAASQRFGPGRPAFETRVLDIEQPPAEQGFAPGSCDIVLASNVLHAAGDLREALAHARSLLAPGGVLVLLETLAPRRWTALTFGLTAGWWRFRDPSVRTTDPTLPAQRWLPLLAEAGFGAADVVGEALSAGSLHPQAVLIAQARPARAGAWLLVGDQGGVADALATRLRRDGGDAECIDAATLMAWPDDALRAWLGGAAGRWGDRWAGVVHAGALDAARSPAAIAPRLQADLARALVPAQRLACALAGAGLPGSPRLWCLTQGALQADEADRSFSPAQAPLWGWGRSMALEQPGYWGGLVDVDATFDADQAAAAAAQALRADDGEDQVAWRHAGRRVPRLRPVARPTAGRIALDPAGAYLVTGGLGSLGPRFARWLAAHGAREVLLLGRRAPQGEAAERLAALQAELARQGVAVRAQQGDVAEDADLDDLFARARDAGRPVRGVIHAAAAFEPRALVDTSAGELMAALRAKVRGTWALHERLSDPGCDLFVLCSSITGVLGAKGLSAYAAANQALQAVAALRRAAGLSATCIDWGTWHDGRSQAQGRRGNVEALGLRELDDEEGLAWLTALVSQGVREQVVARVDWSQALEAYQVHGRRPILAALAATAVPGAPTEAVPEAPAGGAAAPATLREQCRALAPAQRLQQVAAVVRREVGRVLGLPPQALGERTGFFDLGLDSLMAVQLRRRLSAELGEALPATLTFNFPTVEALAAHLAERLGPAEAPPSAPTSSEPSPQAGGAVAAPAAGTAVDALSDEQVRAELLAEFGDLLSDGDTPEEALR